MPKIRKKELEKLKEPFRAAIKENDLKKVKALFAKGADAIALHHASIQAEKAAIARTSILGF
jgi:hypothetical protein